MKKTKPLGRQKFDAFTLEPIGEQSRSKYLARSGLIKNPTAVGEIYETTSRVTPFWATTMVTHEPYSPFGDTSALTIHFVTPLLYPSPFLPHHTEVLKLLTCDWHWHICDDRSTNEQDALTDYSVRNQNLDQLLQNLHADMAGQVTVVRPEKRGLGLLSVYEEIRKSLNRPALIWLLPPDELWTVEQIHRVRELFLADTSRTAAYFANDYFVGPELIAIPSDPNYVGEIRVWNCFSSYEWAPTTPERLCKMRDDGMWEDIASLHPFSAAETGDCGLRFQHFAYANVAQVQSKATAFALPNLEEAWIDLSATVALPQPLTAYLPWEPIERDVYPLTQLEVFPIARCDLALNWRTTPHAPQEPSRTRLILIHLGEAYDLISACSILPSMRSHYGLTHVTFVCAEPNGALLKNSPYLDRVVTIRVEQLAADGDYRQSQAALLESLKGSIAIQLSALRNQLGDFAVFSTAAPQRVTLHGEIDPLDLSYTHDVRDQHNRLYTHVVKTGPTAAPILGQYHELLLKLGVSHSSLAPVTWTSDGDEQYAQEVFLTNQLTPSQTVALVVTGSYEVQDYPHLLTLIEERSDLEWVLLGSAPLGADATDRIQKLGVKSVDLAGKTSLHQATSIIRRCRALVGIGSPYTQIAESINVPHVVIHAGANFWTTLSSSPLSATVSVPLSCFGCLWNCAFDQTHCLAQIRPQTVARALNALLSEAFSRPRVYLQEGSEVEISCDPTHIDLSNDPRLSGHEVVCVSAVGTEVSTASAKLNAPESTEIIETGFVMLRPPQELSGSAVPIVLASPTPKTEEIDGLIDRALECFRNGKLDEGQNHIELAKSYQLPVQDLLYVEAIGKTQARDFEGALACLEEELKLFPNNRLATQLLEQITTAPRNFE